MIDRYVAQPEIQWKNDALDHLRESACWHQRRYHGFCGGRRRIAMSPSHYEKASRIAGRGCNLPHVRMAAVVWKHLEFSAGGDVRQSAFTGFQGGKSVLIQGITAIHR